jgi:mRNA interferase RelE/StbE
VPKVRLTASAARTIRDLPPPLDGAAMNALTVLEMDAEAGHRLRGRLAGVRSLRIGSYRILYAIEEDGALVRVLAVRHRSTAYKSDPR